MNGNVSRWRAFALFHLALIAAAGVSFLYAFLTARFLPPSFYHCPMHDLLRLYCPFCGGTRALRALAELRFAEAFLLSPVCLSLLPLAAAADIRAFVLLCRGSEKRLLPSGVWFFFAAWLIAGTGVRNVLMLCGTEYTGELYAFWSHVPPALRAAAGIAVALAAAGVLLAAGKPLFGSRVKK